MVTSTITQSLPTSTHTLYRALNIVPTSPMVSHCSVQLGWGCGQTLLHHCAVIINLVYHHNSIVPDGFDLILMGVPNVLGFSAFQWSPLPLCFQHTWLF